MKNRVLNDDGSFGIFDPKRHGDKVVEPKPSQAGKMIKSEEVLEKSEESVGGKSLEELTKAELKALLMEKDIKFDGRANKESLLKLLGVESGEEEIEL